MALIQCPECGGKVSDQAKVCVHCGYPIAERIMKKASNLKTSLEIDTYNNKTADCQKALYVNPSDKQESRENYQLLIPYRDKKLQEKEIIDSLESGKLSINDYYELNGSKHYLITLAIRNGDMSVIRFICNHNAKLDYIDTYSSDTERISFPPLGHALVCLSNAKDVETELKYEEIVNMLLKTGANPKGYGRVLARDSVEMMMSCISIASGNCNKRILQTLFEAGSDVNQTLYYSGYTDYPLYFAFVMKKYENASFLIEKGANVDTLIKTPEADYNMINWAVMNDDIKMLEMLLNAGAKANPMRHSHGEKAVFPALGDAIAKNNYQMVSLLIQHNASVNSTAIFNNGTRMSVMQLAKEVGNSNIISILNAHGAH